METVLDVRRVVPNVKHLLKLHMSHKFLRFSCQQNCGRGKQGGVNCRDGHIHLELYLTDTSQMINIKVQTWWIPMFYKGKCQNTKDINMWRKFLKEEGLKKHTKITISICAFWKPTGGISNFQKLPFRIRIIWLSLALAQYVFLNANMPYSFKCSQIQTIVTTQLNLNWTIKLGLTWKWLLTTTHHHTNSMSSISQLFLTWF